MSDEIEITDGRVHCCTECSNWFFGCLNGREKWKDKAIMPNHREFKLESGTVESVCDAFVMHPDPCRKGRAVWDCECDSVESEVENAEM